MTSDLIGRIWNEDCLETMKRMEDRSVDLIVTDPPYGIGYDLMQNQIAESGRESNGGRWKSYEPTDWDYAIPSEQVFREIFRVSRNQVIWGGTYFSLPSNNKWLIWNKVQRGYMTDGEMAWTSFSGGVSIFDFSRADAYINKTDGKFHPTQKPVQLIQWVLNRFSRDTDIVYDPFMGSGTTAVACEKLGRRWIGSEINPDYCKIAEKRIEAVRAQGNLFP